MRFIIYLLIGWCIGHSLHSCVAHADPPEKWFTEKQELHFFAAYALDSTVSQMVPGSRMKKLIISNFITLNAAYLKEVFDTHPSSSDFLAGAAGAASYSLVHLTFNF